MNYSNIISDFTWSYSRIGQFEMCPYGFLLSYIKKADKKPMFFSDYGSFMHKLIELYLRGFLEKEELTGAYVSGFRKNVRGKAPSNRIFKSYFDQGYDYLSEIDFPYLSPVGVEQKVDFLVGDKPFTGIIDCVAMDDGKLVILDNKSRALKPRSGRKKPTVSDAELDSYLRQLYLYILNSKVYVGDSREPLELHCRADCVPYYPYIIASSYMDNVEKKGIIHLTAKSWVDIEAERYGEMGIHQYYRDKLRNEMEKAAAEGENYGKE